MPVEVIDETTALLVRARGLLERGWCRNARALDSDGQVVDEMSERAVAWCAWGALYAAGLPRYGWSIHPAALRLNGAIGSDIGPFNDRQTRVEPVLAAFDRAIAAGRVED